MIKASLGISEIHYLKKNFRNSFEIAKLAKAFFTGMSTGIPELPDRTSENPKYVIYNTRSEMFDAISRFERNNTDLDIGVFVPYQTQVKSYTTQLQAKTQNNVQSYARTGKTAPSLDFSTKGIKVTTFHSAKGLEFDAVYIPAVNKIGPNWDRNSPSTEMMFYVLISRARDMIEINQFKTDMSPLASHLQERVEETSQ